MFDIIVKLYLIVISNWLVVVLRIEYVFYVKYNCDIVKKICVRKKTYYMCCYDDHIKHIYKLETTSSHCCFLIL